MVKYFDRLSNNEVRGETKRESKSLGNESIEVGNRRWSFHLVTGAKVF